MLTARTADKYELYRKSVQTPEADARFLNRHFRKLTGKPLRLFREDFCGTGAVVCEFVKLHRGNRGIGIDLDPEPLQWCRDHLVSKLQNGQANNVTLISADVARVHSPKVEMIAAMNFSYSIFHSRKELLAYFKNVKRSLLPYGVFVLDSHGGREVPNTGKDFWSVRNFKYVWDVRDFDPVTHNIDCRIHFVFPDGSRIKNAFVYNWRLWTLPELRDTLEEAGFKTQYVLWEETNRHSGYGNGRMRRVTRAQWENVWYAILLCH